MTTLHSKKSIKPSPLRRGFRSVALALVCFALSQAVQAVSPPPDGGYPGANTAEGDSALLKLQDGVINNTAIGAEALRENTIGRDNTGVGNGALFNNVDGNWNTAVGSFAMEGGSHGSNNTATGYFVLQANDTGSNNTAVGVAALRSNNSDNNTAIGYNAAEHNIEGQQNTATGAFALNISNGSYNTATGFQALLKNSAGEQNTANGFNSLLLNDSGSFNTATGAQALQNNMSGTRNTANGLNALRNNTIGSSNIAMGAGAGVNLTTGDSNIDIGNPGSAGDAGTIRIGVQGTQTRTFVAGISGSPIAGTSVVVNSVGRLGTVASSRRFKDDIKPMDKASEAILALKPVTFRYKKEVDPDGIPQFGLVAEQVEKVNPDLVAHDNQGKVYTVRYEAVSIMLLNEFLKEHRKNEEQEATIAVLQKQIEALAAGLQKVSAQLEVSKPAPQIVNNNQ